MKKARSKICQAIVRPRITPVNCEENPAAKILFWDLETGGVNALRSDLGVTLCFGYKWLGDDDVHVLTVDKFPGWFTKAHGVQDKGLLIAAVSIMDEAELLVAHYGDKFDRRFLQGRLAIHGLPSPSPVKQRDTWRIARRAFNYSSNRLGNLAMTLGLTEQKHQKTRDEWPGWWFRAMAGDQTAIHEMAEYCAQDVRTLEEIYFRIRQYDYPHPRLVIDRSLCGICGSKDITYHGFAYVGQNRYRQFQCKSCGKWDRERKAKI